MSTIDTSKTQNRLIDFMLREWILTVSAVGYVLTSAYVGDLPALSSSEWQVLLILFALFVAIRGLQNSGFMDALSRRVERGRAIPLKLVAGTFFLSMLVTNDAALIVMVPLTLALDTERKGLLVILEALAANAGSALTPFGNPQNLFIYCINPATNYVVLSRPERICGKAPHRRQGYSLSRCGNAVHGCARGGRTL
ncbi:SLC13 family permease [Thiolapillus sp.]